MAHIVPSRAASKLKRAMPLVRREPFRRGPTSRGQSHEVKVSVPSFKPVVAVARGLEVLRVINEERISTVRSLNKATGLDKATIVRMLETLEHEGYVMRDAERAVYALTGRTLLLSQGYDQHLWIGSVVEPTLRKFRKEIGWPSDVALFDRDAMIVAQTSRDTGLLLFNRTPGFRFPLLGTSLGRAYLAYCPEPEQSQIIEALAKSPGHWNDIARNPKRLTRILQEVRDRGYSLMDADYSREEYEGTVWAMGVPIRNDKQVLASINIMMLRSAISQEDGVKRFLLPLQRTAAMLAKQLTIKPRAAARV